MKNFFSKSIIALILSIAVIFGAAKGAEALLCTPTSQAGTGVCATAGFTGVVIGNGKSPFTAVALPSDATKYLDGTGVFSVPAGGSGGVTSFNTRTGAVVPVAGDYAALTETLSNKTLTSPVINTGLSGTAFGTGIPTFLLTPSSANLASAITDETGSGALAFATSPTFTTPVLGAATASSVTFPATSAGTVFCNQVDCTTNFEKELLQFNSNIFTIYGSNAGTGSLRESRFGDGADSFSSNGAASLANPKFAAVRTGDSTASLFNIATSGNFTGSTSITQYGLKLSYGVNQTSTAGFEGIVENATETAKGAGLANLIDLQVGGATKFNITDTGSTIVTSPSANALTVGAGGLTNPAFNIDTSAATSVTGLNIAAKAAGSGLAITTTSTGTNENTTFDAKGSGTITLNAIATGKINLGNSTAGAGVAIFGPTAVTSANSLALAVGRNGSTNPVLDVDDSTATAVAGISIKGNAAAAGANIAVISSGTNEPLTVDAKGSGLITIGGNSTGGVSVGNGLTSTLVGASANNFSGQVKVGYDSTTVPMFSAGAGTDTSSWLLTASGGRTMYGYTTADTLGNEAMIFNAGGAKGIDFLVNGTNSTFLTGTYAMELLSDATVLVPAPGNALHAVLNTDAAQTLTNKRITSRVNTITSSATPTINADTTDTFTITALAAGATFASPTGTTTDAQKLLVRIKDNGISQSLAFNVIFRAGDIAFPTATVINKTLYLGFIYNAADSKWDYISQTGNF